MKLNQTDLNVRLQLINCCYSTMSTNFANDLRYGRKCVTKDRLTLSLLGVYMKILESYQVSTNAVGSVTISNGDAGSTVQVLIGGVAISPVYTLVSYVLTSMSELANLINLYQSNYIATYDSTNHVINIVSNSCTNDAITTIRTGKMSTVVTGLENGSCKSNCFSETEIQNIIDKISELTGLNFKPIGFTYTT